MWPNFLIVGSAKSGTTSLYSYLDKVDGIFMSKIKEPHYFHNGSFRIGSRIINDKSKYLKLFKGVTNEKAIGEASTSYLEDPESPRLIHDEIPNAKIIIILRDPCQRTFSAYYMFKSEGRTEKSFYQIITTEPNFLRSALYYSQVKRYLDWFGPNQVKVLIFEEFINNPNNAIKEILEFLQVNCDLPEIFGKIHNPYSVPRTRFSKKIVTSNTLSKIANQILPKSVKSKLRDEVIMKIEKKPEISKDEMLVLEKYYRDDVLKLENILKRKLPWPWLKNTTD